MGLILYFYSAMQYVIIFDAYFIVNIFIRVYNIIESTILSHNKIKIYCITYFREIYYAIDIVHMINRTKN